MISLALQGRPEQLIPLLLAIAAATMAFQPKTYQRLITAGICCGLVSMTSPLSGIMTGVEFITFHSLSSRRSNSRVIINSVFVTFVATLSLMASLHLLSPFDGVTWVRNVLSTGSGAQSFARSFFSPRVVVGLTTFAPLWNILCISLWTTSAALLYSQKRAAALLLLILTTILFGQKAADYSYLGLLPASYLGMLHITARGHEQRTQPGTTLRTILTVPAVIAYIAWATGYLLLVAEAIHRQAGFLGSLGASEAEIEAALDKSGNKARPFVLGYPALHTPSLVVFNKPGFRPAISTSYPTTAKEPGKNIIELLEEREGFRLSHYILPQPLEKRDKRPPSIIYVGSIHFLLVKDNWNSTISEESAWPPALGAMGNHYQVAIYERDN